MVPKEPPNIPNRDIYTPSPLSLIFIVELLQLLTGLSLDWMGLIPALATENNSNNNNNVKPINNISLYGREFRNKKLCSYNKNSQDIFLNNESSV